MWDLEEWWCRRWWGALWNDLDVTDRIRAHREEQRELVVS